MIALALLLQTVPVAPVTRATAAPPASFSILYQDCPARTGSEVVVCADSTTTSPRLPLPDDAPPTPNYVKPDSGDYRDNDGNYATPCAARMSGCQVGFGPPIMPMIAAAVTGLRNAAANRREARARAADGDRRVAIDLDAEGSPGRLEP